MRITALLAIAALAACTRPSPSPSAPVDLAEAADRVATAGTARLDLEVTIDGGIVATGHGGFDTAAGARWLTIDLRRLSGAGDAVVGFVVHGDDAWVRVPEGGTQPWFRVAAIGADPPLPGPEHFLDVVRDAEGTARVVGADEIDGRPTTRLRVQAVLPDGLVPGSLASDAPEPVDVWVDADGRVRRIRAHPPSPVGVMALTVDLSGFGRPVEVPVPAREEVTVLR